MYWNICLPQTVIVLCQYFNDFFHHKSCSQLHLIPLQTQRFTVSLVTPLKRKCIFSSGFRYACVTRVWVNFTQCCNDSLTQYIVGHWASLKLEVKWPWISTVDMVFSSELSFISMLGSKISPHCSNSVGCLSMYYGLKKAKNKKAYTCSCNNIIIIILW